MHARTLRVWAPTLSRISNPTTNSNPIKTPHSTDKNPPTSLQNHNNSKPSINQFLDTATNSRETRRMKSTKKSSATKFLTSNNNNKLPSTKTKLFPRNLWPRPNLNNSTNNPHINNNNINKPTNSNNNNHNNTISNPHLNSQVPILS